jgi:hypothetical protein
MQKGGNVKIKESLEGLFLGLLCWGLTVVCISVFPNKLLGAIVALVYGVFFLCDGRRDSQHNTSRNPSTPENYFYPTRKGTEENLQSLSNPAFRINSVK